MSRETSSLPAWQARRPAGQVGIRLMAWLCRCFGWRFGAALLWPITLAFVLRDGAGRRASRRYLSRALGRPPGFGEIFRHFHTFAHTLLDRFFLHASRAAAPFDIRVEGLEHLAEAVAAGKGVILLGAHLGSFEALRFATGAGAPVAIRMVMHRGRRGALTALFEENDPSFAASVIALPASGGDGIALALALRETLAGGGVVGLLADRVAAGQAVMTADFLGAPAPFPLGPFRLAAATGAPVLLGFGLRLARRRYLVHIEPFVDAIPPCRAGDAAGERPAEPWAALRPHVTRYAERLSHFCREYPYNWFNFHDVWENDDESGRSRRPPRPAARASLAGAGGDAAADHRGADG